MAYSSSGGVAMFVADHVVRETGAQARKRGNDVSASMQRNTMTYDALIVKSPLQYDAAPAKKAVM